MMNVWEILGAVGNVGRGRGWSRACRRDKLNVVNESDLSSFRDRLMTSSPQLSRTPWIALAALTGTLLATDEASACSATEARTAPRSCCTSRRAAGCGCCRIPVQGEPARTTVSVVRSELSSPGSRLLFLETRPACLIPESTCSCRPHAPVEPAPRPAQRTSGDDRLEQGHAETLSSALLSDLASPPFGAPNLPAVSPSQGPLYLRTSRLLL